MVGKELNAKLMEKLQQAGRHSQIFNFLESESVDYFSAKDLGQKHCHREVDCGFRTPSNRGGRGGGLQQDVVYRG